MIPLPIALLTFRVQWSLFNKYPSLSTTLFPTNLTNVVSSLSNLFVPTALSFVCFNLAVLIVVLLSSLLQYAQRVTRS